MIRNSLLAAMCVCLLIPAFAISQDDREKVIARTLAVQRALQQGRQAMLERNFRDAVTILESQLPNIDGSREYLAAMRDAYRGLVAELRIAKNETEAQIYLRRLVILDPTAAGDTKLASSVALASKGKAQAQIPLAQVGGGESRGEGSNSKFVGNESASHPQSLPHREKTQPDSPRRPATASAQAKPDSQPKILASRPAVAEQTMVMPSALPATPPRDYLPPPPSPLAALPPAPRAEPPALLLPPGECRVEGGPARSPGGWDERQGQADAVADASLPPAAVRLTSQESGRKENFLQEQARNLLHKAGEAIGTASPAQPVFNDIKVKHQQGKDGWLLAESANFRVFHKQTCELAEKCARVAEQTRTVMHRKWFGESERDWNPKCDIVIYRTADEYSRATGKQAVSPGHSTIESDGARIIRWRIDLHSDYPAMAAEVLPHETTHVVLAGKFSDRGLPRWADEGMAVLSEPRERIERHLALLPKQRHERQLFSIRKLMEMNDYPEARLTDVFYSQSVSVVEFLVNQKGPRIFTQFLRDGQRSGYEAALKKHYNYQHFADLEQCWTVHVFRDKPNGGRLTANGDGEVRAFSQGSGG